MRVLAVGMFDRTYPRNRVVLEAMRRQGIGVEVCHVPVWELERDKERGYAGVWNRTKLVARLLYAQFTLLFRWLTHRWDADVIWIGFPGHCDMPLAWLIGKCTGRPVVFDAFISWYDSAVRDRGMFPKKSFTARLLYFWDFAASHLADRVILDTPEHAAFFQEFFKLPARKVGWLPVSADEHVFKPVASGAGSSDGRFRVLQYAEFTPLHGGEHVLDAAERLQERGSPVVFEVIGDGGPLFESLKADAAKRGLSNIEFSGYVPEKTLVERIAAADLCLGVFGAGEKAGRVIPNKVYQCLACARPVLTGDTVAMRRVFAADIDLAMCDVGSGEALADAVDRLRLDAPLRERLAEAGYARFREQFSTEAIAAWLERELQLALAARETPDDEAAVEAANVA